MKCLAKMKLVNLVDSRPLRLRHFVLISWHPRSLRYSIQYIHLSCTPQSLNLPQLVSTNRGGRGRGRQSFANCVSSFALLSLHSYQILSFISETALMCISFLWAFHAKCFLSPTIGTVGELEGAAWSTDSCAILSEKLLRQVIHKVSCQKFLKIYTQQFYSKSWNIYLNQKYTGCFSEPLQRLQFKFSLLY